MAREWTLTGEHTPRRESSGALRSSAKTRAALNRLNNVIDIDKEKAIMVDFKDILVTVDQTMAQWNGCHAHT
jgi:hypothetical protein